MAASLKSRDGMPRQAPAPPRFSRSGQMVQCLREELLYSEKRPRDLLFTAIERGIAERDDELIVARLTRDAARLAQIEGQRTMGEFAHWNTAAKAVMKAMLCSASLLDPDGAPIPFGVSAAAAHVGGVTADYRDRTEAFLLEVVLRRLGDVTLRDHTALAHALFRQFDRSVPMHALEDRVAILAARLADRISLSGDTYIVTEPPPAR